MKGINIKIPDELHIKLKIQSAKERKTLQEITTSAIEEYIDNRDNCIEINGILFEPPGKEDEEDIKQGKRDIAEENYEDMDKVFRELDRE